MKRSWVLVLLVGMGLVGCAEPKPYTLGKVFREVPPPRADMAQVVFYHLPIQGLFLGSPRSEFMNPVHEDDQVVSGLVQTTYALHDATPGRHEYSVGDGRWGRPSADVAVQAGRTYFIRYTFRMTPFFNWNTVELVPEAVGLEELETLRQLHFHKDIYAAQ